jgi:very-short-patch-repair endonuclease
LNKFDSAHEIVAAVILIHNEVRTKTQYKVGAYRVDFYLPELKIVLEIDGERHRHKKQHDNERDIFIRKELGSDHEIIRVKTERIEENAELLVEAIKSIKEERQELRKKNFGCLPTWYK